MPSSLVLLLSVILSAPIIAEEIIADEVIAVEVTFKSLKPAQSNNLVAIQGGLLLGQTAPSNQIIFNEQPVRVTEEGAFLIGFGRDSKDSEIIVINTEGVVQKQFIRVKSRDYKIERVDGLPPSKVTPRGEAVKKRIAQEGRLVKAARKIDTQLEHFNEGFIWPVSGRISGVYGSQRVLNGQPRRPHFGVDIARPTGTVIVAPVSGVVTLAENDLYFSGGTLMIDHGHGLSSSFLHLSELMVAKGQIIKKGEPIAKIGSTGRATGAHLDWRMNWFSVRVDPQLLVGEMKP